MLTFFFQYLDSFLIITYRINCFLFRQHCDYLIVLNLSMKSYFARNCKKMFFKRLQKRNKGQTSKKNKKETAN